MNYSEKNLNRQNTSGSEHEPQNHFQILMENFPGIIFRCKNDKNWTMTYISSGCYELTGYKPDDLVDNHTLPFGDLIHQDDRERVWNEVTEHLKEKDTYTLEYRLITSDHRLKWVWEKGKKIEDESGKVQWIEGFITDISDLKESQQVQACIFGISKAAYGSQKVDDLYIAIHQNLGNVLDATNFFVAMYNPVNDTLTLPYHVDNIDRFTEFPAGKTMTGYVIHTKTPVLANEAFISHLAETGVIDIIGHPAKSWLGVPLMIHDNAVGALVVQSYSDDKRYSDRELKLMTFIADQVVGMIIRKTVEDSLQEEKSYLNQLFQSSSEAITMIDNHGIVQSINNEFTKLFGYKPDEITGQSLDDFIVPKFLRDEGIRNTSRALSNERVEAESIRQHKNGMLIDVSILVTPIIINEKIVGAYGIYRDISERKRIEKSLITAKEKAEESDRLKSAFLSNMSHEIRTPMNAILGFSSLLSDPNLTPEEQQEYINIIKDRGNDLLKIISDIIDVAKIESGQLKVSIKDCKINILLNDLLATFRQIKHKQGREGVELRCRLGRQDSEFTILTDPQRLRQVLTNLIENAIKFTERGYVEFGYQIKDDQGLGQSIEFYVKDTGIGIPDEMQPIIFERFRQVDDSHTRKYGGTGLGLTISRNLIHLMGGDLNLTSAVGRGTLFTLTLPMWTTTPEAKTVASPTHPKTGQRDWKGKVILVAEDEESNYIFLEHVLKKTGITLLWAKNGIEAVNMAKSNQIDLILMDIRMPGMDGYEATSIIKKEHKHIPVIAQTAYALKGEKELSFNSGCDDYISKPINIQELLSVLEKYIHH